MFGIPTIAPGTIDPKTGGAELTGGGYVWRRANTRYGYDESVIDQTDLSGTFHTGAIKHSFALGTEFSWEQSRRGAYVLSTGSTISPRCDTVTLDRYYCTSLFDPNPNDPWVNYASDTSTTPAPITRGGPRTETQNDASTQAIYAFDSITLLPQLILNLGARFDRFHSRVTLPIATTVTPLAIRRTDDLFNWQAGLVFKPSASTSVYASYATAATPPNSLLGEGREDNSLGTTTTAAAIADTLKVQKTRSYEVGAKANVLHDRLALGVAAFQTDIRNARVTDADNNVAFIGRTRIRGVELTASGTILPGWTVFGGYTHLDPRIVDGGFTALTAGTVPGQAAQVVLVPSVNTGKQVPQTARDSISLWSEVRPVHRLTLGGGAFYMSRVFGGYADNRAAVQNAAGVVTVIPATKTLYRQVPSYWRFDARIAYQLTDAVQLSVNAQNLTNKAYFTQAYTSHYATIAPGRTVFGTIGLRF